MKCKHCQTVGSGDWCEICGCELDTDSITNRREACARALNDYGYDTKIENGHLVETDGNYTSKTYLGRHALATVELKLGIIHVG